jgi:predicted nucleotidyltransferase/HEPN domain-containing protein
MRTDVDHLPPAKQRELERVVQIIFEEFDDALRLATHEWKKRGRIEKIILFGSHARGGWVDEPHTAKGYQSDFDLLIIVNHKKLTDKVDYWLPVEERLNRERSIAKTLRTPVNLIVHTLQEVNANIADGRYFFMDIAKDGIALYQYQYTDLHEPKPKTPAAALEMAREYFEEWGPSGRQFLETAQFSMSRGWNKKAAFLMHQAVESLYNCTLLVCTFYTPHVHNIGFLRSHAEQLDERLVAVWPRETKADTARFEKLKDAYVKARYSKHYRITEEELAWLGERVEELTRVVNVVCSERISQLEMATRKTD